MSYLSESDCESQSENQINDLSTGELSTDSNDEIVIDEKKPDIEIIKKLVDLCVKYENDLVKINNLKKAITVKLKKTREKLIPYMKKKEIDHINLNENHGGGKIRYNKKKVYKPLSKKKMIDLLNIYFKNIDEAKKIIKFLYDNREVKFVNNLVKTKPTKKN